MYCADCEAIDSYFYDSTHFWLFFPTAESMTKAIVYCGTEHFSATQHSAKCLEVIVTKDRLQNFLISLFGEFQGPELAKTKITTTESTELDLDAVSKVLPADVLINRFNSRWLVDSIEKNCFESHYQAIVEVDKNGEINPIGQEALFRIKDELGNNVPPDHAFSLAEHSDLLFSLDLVARRSAVSHYIKAGLAGKLFINFNPSSIYDPSYCLRATTSAINELGIHPSNVVFEITETHQIKNQSLMKGLLNFYRNAGFQVAIDDIGSGYAGLNMLHTYQPDYVKIDMELVRGLDTNYYKRSIVKHLIEIANSNSTKVIAEGIETEQEFSVLRELGADYYQGYYFAKPKFQKFTCSQELEAKVDSILGGIQ